jgi:uncharacterized protein (TIGR03437 family)
MQKLLYVAGLTFLLGHVAVLAQSSITVINGARFEVRYPVSPGAYAQAYGTFSGVTVTFATAVPLTTELGGVRVMVNDVPAPLVAVATEAVSFVVPQATQPGRANVRVVRGSDILGAGTADVLPVSPGIFFVNDARAQGGVLNHTNGYAVQTAPATRGQAIQIFATGQGALDTTVADGAVPPTGTLARARGVTKVFVSGYEAPVSFSGLSPEFPGLWQINANLPNQTFLSGRVALIVTIDGVPSNQVTFWVAE